VNEYMKAPQTTNQKIVRFAIVFGVGMAVFFTITILRHM